MVPMLRPLWQGCLTFTPLANRPAGYLQFPTALLLCCCCCCWGRVGIMEQRLARLLQKSILINSVSYFKLLLPTKKMQFFSFCYFEHLYRQKRTKLKQMLTFMMSGSSTWLTEQKKCVRIWSFVDTLVNNVWEESSSDWALRFQTQHRRSRTPFDPF